MAYEFETLDGVLSDPGLAVSPPPLTLTLTATGDEAIDLPVPVALFSARYGRDGSDLVLQNGDAVDIRVIDYFDFTPADLVTPRGAHLEGALVERLAGPVAPGEYAQTAIGDANQPIGQVELVSGTARVRRADGSEDVLQEGSLVYQDDIVSTDDGASLSLTFVDGTMFTLAANARMVLDELVYVPAGTDNSAVFNLLEGGFVFVAGQLARTGDMEVTTPTATMGICGTTVLVDIILDGELATV